jgi:hypothetical protein
MRHIDELQTPLCVNDGGLVNTWLQAATPYVRCPGFFSRGTSSHGWSRFTQRPMFAVETACYAYGNRPLQH